MQTDAEKNSAKIRRTLRAKLKAYFKQTLEPSGFVKDARGSCWSKNTKTLSQSCLYSFPRDHYVRIEYGYDFVPSIECPDDISQDSQAQETLSRFNKELTEFQQLSYAYVQNRDWNVPLTLEEIDAVLTEIDVYFTQEIRPFFDKYRQASEILSEYENGVIGPEYINCSGEPWFSVHLALIRYQAKKYDAETLELFQNVLLESKERGEYSDLWKTIGEGVELVVESLKKRLNRNIDVKD